MQAVVFMAFFAAAWWVAGVLGAHQAVGLAAIGPAISVAMIAAARARFKGAVEDPAHRKRRGRIVGWAAGLEGLAIFLAINVLTQMGLAAYAFPAVAVIVGLHFLPLARLLPMGVYYLSAALLVAVGIGGAMAPPSERPLIVGVLSAITLWLTCGVRLAKAPKTVAA